MQPTSNVAPMAGGAKATKKDRDRAAFLRDAINLHNERYFAHDAPEVSDAESLPVAS